MKILATSSSGSANLRTVPMGNGQLALGFKDVFVEAGARGVLTHVQLQSRVLGVMTNRW